MMKFMAFLTFHRKTKSTYVLYVHTVNNSKINKRIIFCLFICFLPPPPTQSPTAIRQKRVSLFVFYVRLLVKVSCVPFRYSFSKQRSNVVCNLNISYNELCSLSFVLYSSVRTIRFSACSNTFQSSKERHTKFRVQQKTTEGEKKRNAIGENGVCPDDDRRVRDSLPCPPFFFFLPVRQSLPPVTAKLLP